jgi:hypothetical protein
VSHHEQNQDVTVAENLDEEYKQFEKIAANVHMAPMETPANAGLQHSNHSYVG